MNKNKTIIVGITFILALFVTGCVEQQDDINTQVGDGILQLKLTDKPGDLDIIHANVTISTVQVHRAEANESDGEEDNEDFENIDEYDDGFIADGDGPYFAEVGENISFIGNATGGITPYNWSWDFGDST